MRDVPNDLFARYYAEKLWEMIPPVYRHEDGIADRPGVLRALVEVLAGQAAIVRRSNDRAWEDQFVELSDDWAVSYLGDLVGTRMVSALDRRGRRADVANTIFYRRRAGTLAVLEGLIADITGWEGTVVEEYRRLVRHPHGMDPGPARTGSRTDTPLHGLPDLRQPRGSQLAWGPWDEYHHLPDVRRNRGGMDGRYGITKVAFHLYRLLAFTVPGATPWVLKPDANGKQRFTFDPSGRLVPLFQRHARPAFEFDWRPALEWELPAPIRCEVLASAEFVVREADILTWLDVPVITPAEAADLRALRGIRFPSEARFLARLAALPTGALGAAAVQRILADALAADCGKAVLLPSSTDGTDGDSSSVIVARQLNGKMTPYPRERTVAADLSAGAVAPPDKVLMVDAEHGLAFLASGPPPKTTACTYAYGSSGNVGAGTYPRPGLPSVPPAGVISGGGAITGLVGGNDAALEIDDSATYGPVQNIAVVAKGLLQAKSGQRPYVELASDWTVTATQPGGSLTIDGLWLGGRGPRTIHLAAATGASWAAVTLRGTTLDPGGMDADGGPLGPIVLAIDSPIAELQIESSILGPVVVAGAGLVERLTVRESILQTTDPVGWPVVLAQPRGELDIRGTTVIGDMAVHRLDASELLCTGTITVDDLQAGCIRFSAFAPGSQVPRAYRTQSVTDARSLFTSTRFGDPGYGQLSDLAPDTILRGGEDGIEIGAFSSLLNPIKLDSLKAKVDEFLPFGLIPHFITET
jgi:hypothetical protein